MVKKRLIDLLPGDVVYEVGRYSSGRLAVVNKVTKCYIKIGSRMYRKDEGYEGRLATSDSWTYGSIKTLSEEELANYRRIEETERKRAYIASTPFSSLPLEVVDKIYNILKEAEK